MKIKLIILLVCIFAAAGSFNAPVTGLQPEPQPPALEQPQPEPQPPVTAKDVLIVSVTDGLRVRSGMSAESAVVGSLDKNDMLPSLALVSGWHRVIYNGGTAYVSARYVKYAEFNKGGDAVESVIDEGKKLLGKPYVYGAQRYCYNSGKLNPNYDGKSYDCSSLMQYIFKKGANVTLAMTSREQSLQGTTVKKADIRRGDLLFFTNASRRYKTGLERIGHVALYLGDNIILHTASDHAVIEPISATRDSYFITAKRVL